MRVFISLAFSILVCALLIKRIPQIWLITFFVYFPVTGIFLRKILDKYFAKHILYDELSGLYSLKSEAPILIRWYSNALEILLGMLVGFSIVYFFNGGWTK